MTWKESVMEKTQKIEELLIDVNWTIEEGENKLQNCNDECQKEKVIEWLKEAKELIDDVIKTLEGDE